MRRSTLWKLCIIPALAIITPLLSAKPAHALICHCWTDEDCQVCVHRVDPTIVCMPDHTCLWL